MKTIKTEKINLMLCLLAVMLAAVLALTLTAAPQVAAAALTTSDAEIIAGRTVSASELETIQNGFSTKASGLSLGNAGQVTTSREILLYQEYDNSGSKSLIAYNFALNSYFVVDSEFYAAYKNDDTFRKLGAPTSDKGTLTVSGRSRTATIAKASYTAQVFETGIIIKNGANVETYLGAVETVSDGYVLHPVIDDQDILEYTGSSFEFFGNIDGEMHPLKDADFFSEGSGDSLQYKLYANFSGCCVNVVYKSDYSIKEQYVYAAKNFFKSNGVYNTAILPSSCIDISDFVCDGSNPVDSDALAYYRTYQSDGTNASLISLFEDCYSGLLSDGFVAGYRCSKIKMWTILALDLKYGDGTTGFDVSGSGDRERMTCLVYNPSQNKVYPVYNSFFLIYKEDDGVGRNVLGYPESGVYTNKTIGGTTYSEIQIFQNGYIYRTSNGNYVGEAGYKYDAAKNVFVPETCPTVPDRYGAETSRRTTDDAVYINYEKGAIKCELTNNKSKYFYTYYNGRQFDFSADGYPTSLLAQNALVKYAELISKGAMPLDNDNNSIDFANVIKPLIYEKYTELYNSGYFCGFVEEEFKGSWNNVFAQQFVVGDSSSMIFGEERPNVSAIVYNPRTGEVYLMKDAVIKTWQGNYGTAGAPTSDEHQISGCDFWFQTFDFGMTIRYGNTIVFTEDYDSPEAYVSELNENRLTFPTHGNDQASGYVG